MSNQRTVKFSLGRIGSDAADVETGTLSDAVFGSITNIAGGETTYGYNDGYGPSGRDRYWNGTFQIEDLTFDLVNASQNPRSLGPAVLVLELYDSYYEDDGTLITAKIRYQGRFMNPGSRTFDRTTDSPMSLTFYPFELIEGGDANRSNMAKDQAAVYSNTRTGDHSTREGGTAARIDWVKDFRVAHGVDGVDEEESSG